MQKVQRSGCEVRNNVSDFNKTEHVYFLVFHSVVKVRVTGNWLRPSKNNSIKTKANKVWLTRTGLLASFPCVDAASWPTSCIDLSQPLRVQIVQGGKLSHGTNDAHFPLCYLISSPPPPPCPLLHTPLPLPQGEGLFQFLFKLRSMSSNTVVKDPCDLLTNSAL